jgi:hypothetical protein
MSSALFRSMTRIEGFDAVIRVYDEAGNVIEAHEHAGAAAIAFPHLDFPRLLASLQPDVVLTKNELDRAPLKLSFLRR